MNSYDVTIIGAGVSGLTCARHLLSAGVKIKILETRLRAGGRLLTDPSSPYPVPAELGAEFIHGAPKKLLQFFTEQGLSFVDAADQHLFLRGKSLVEKKEFWEDLEVFTKKLDPERTPDRSVSDFLSSVQKRPRQEIEKLFKAYVEGFQAADLNLMGERSLAENEQTEDEDLNGIELFRPLGGYQSFVDKMLHSEIEAVPGITKARHKKELGVQKMIAYGSTAKEVRWSRGQAEILYRKSQKTFRVRSKLVITTLPVGVLKTPSRKAGINFIPSVPTLDRALNSLHAGHVHRITFEFKTRFWEQLHDKGVSFLHTGPENFFPTWWTQWPVRSPLLIAWQGGPKALELSKMSAEQREAEALKTLQKLTGKSKGFLENTLVRAHSHDWNLDPYSLGAYSYTGLQHGNVLSALRKPVAQTLLFAGEATAEGTAQGTVQGAFDSGLRAAAQALKILKK